MLNKLDNQLLVIDKLDLSLATSESVVGWINIFAFLSGSDFFSGLSLNY